MQDGDKHIFSRFPVDALPDELRVGFEREAFVRVIIEREAAAVTAPLTSFIGSGKGVYAQPEEAIKTLRDIRNEWEN